MGHGPHHVRVPQVDNPIVRSDLSRLLGLASATRRIVASHRLIFGESTSGESKNELRTNSMPAFVFATRNGFCCTALRGQQRWGDAAKGVSILRRRMPQMGRQGNQPWNKIIYASDGNRLDGLGRAS
jgi:hypothetical protein